MLTMIYPTITEKEQEYFAFSVKFVYSVFFTVCVLPISLFLLCTERINAHLSALCMVRPDNKIEEKKMLFPVPN